MLPLTRFLVQSSSRMLTAARTLALAVALAAPLTAAHDASAQFGRATPTPVSAEDFARMIAACGLADNIRDVALPMHETYFARFRDFESREITPSLERLGGDFSLGASIDTAKEARDARRRLLQRAAQIDGQLVDEIVGVLTAEDAAKAERLRDALSRRRSATVLPSAGFAGRAETFDLRRTEALAKADATVRDAVLPILDAYAISLTRELERAADAALERPVKAAELRAERNLSNPPAPPEPTDGAAMPIDEGWMRAMGEIQREAGAELAAAMLRVRRLHRDTLAQIAPLVTSEVARAMRDDLIRNVYPMLRAKSDFDAALAEATALRAKGQIDDARWSAATAIIDGHDLAVRGILDGLMDLADKDATDNEGIGFFRVGVDGENVDENSDMARRIRLTKELTEIATREADALRTALGLAAPERQVAGEARLGGLDAGGLAIGGVDIGAAVADAIGDGGGAVQIQAVMVGGDGEAITLSTDDMDDAGMLFFGGVAGGGPRVPKPFTRDELDAIAASSGLDGAQRATFDEIAGRCAESRKSAEDEHGSQGNVMTSEDGGVSITFTVAGDDTIVENSGDAEKLVAAITTAEETMFDELRAAATSDRAEPIEASRRMRARARLSLGETGEHAVDLVRIAGQASLDESARASIDARLREWDVASVAALDGMRREITAANERHDEIWKAATQETTTQTEGGTTIGRAMTLDEATAKELGAIDRRIEGARDRVATANRATRTALEDALAGSPEMQKAFRRAYLRAANPSVYRGARDLAPYFDKAAALEGVGEQARADIARLRGEWIEQREVRCEEFIRVRDEAERESKARANAGGDDDPQAETMEAMRLMGAAQRDRKRLREDLEQIEATSFRKLQDLLLVEVGADRAKELGELPAKRRANVPQIRFGG